MSEILKATTRPLMARRLIYFSMAYIAVMEVATLYGAGNGASWEILGLTLAQPVGYIVGRSAEKIKAGEA